MEDFEIRLVEEENELRERIDKLGNSLFKEGGLDFNMEFYEKVGSYQFVLMLRQLDAMVQYHIVLRQRIDDLGIVMEE